MCTLHPYLHDIFAAQHDNAMLRGRISAYYKAERYVTQQCELSPTKATKQAQIDEY